MESASTPAVLEELEPRLLLSASYADFTGMGNPGSWWQYETHYSGSPGSGTATQTVEIADALKRVKGMKCANVTTTVAGTQSTAAYYTDQSGTYMTVNSQVDDLGTITITLGRLRVGLPSMSAGAVSQSAMAFKGKYQAEVDGRRVRGKVVGIATCTTELVGFEQVSVPAGTFAAARIETSLVMDGTIKVRRVLADYEATASSTQWGVEGLGIAKQISSTTVSVYVPQAGQGATVTLNTNSQLTSSGWRAFETVGSAPDLRPGDLLLYQGKNWLSRKIIRAERRQLGDRAVYSHAAIYLGNGQVAEMLTSGYKVRSIANSFDGAADVDIYRHRQIGSDGQSVADVAATYGGADYAFAQVLILGSLARDRVVTCVNGAFPGLKAATLAWYTQDEAGPQEMICSEMAFRAYSAAGLTVNVQPWQNMSGYDSWPAELRSDFVTPNMLLYGDSFMQVA